MTNSRKCCRSCKEYKYTEDMIKIPSGYVCDMGCINAIVSSDRLKRQEQQLKKAYGAKSGRKKGKTKAECDNDLKTRKAAAKDACHAYIRERDKGLPCICCGRPINGVVHAGHWKESGNNPKIRFNEDNIHAQSGYCNTYKGGDSGDYELNLRAKIGSDKVDWLKTQLGGTIKRTPQDYKEIELYYKNKLKELN